MVGCGEAWEDGGCACSLHELLNWDLGIHWRRRKEEVNVKAQGCWFYPTLPQQWVMLGQGKAPSIPVESTCPSTILEANINLHPT